MNISKILIGIIGVIFLVSLVHARGPEIVPFEQGNLYFKNLDIPSKVYKGINYNMNGEVVYKLVPFAVVPSSIDVVVRAEGFQCNEANLHIDTTGYTIQELRNGISVPFTLTCQAPIIPKTQTGVIKIYGNIDEPLGDNSQDISIYFYSKDEIVSFEQGDVYLSGTDYPTSIRERDSFTLTTNVVYKVKRGNKIPSSFNANVDLDIANCHQTKVITFDIPYTSPAPKDFVLTKTVSFTCTGIPKGNYNGNLRVRTGLDENRMDNNEVSLSLTVLSSNSGGGGGGNGNTNIFNIESIEMYVNGKKSNEAYPGDKVQLYVKVKNTYSSITDAYVKVNSVNLGIQKESDKRDMNYNALETFVLTVTIPLYAEKGSYDLNIVAAGERGVGEVKDTEVVTLTIKRPLHKLVINSAQFDIDNCKGKLFLNIVNIGEYDEDATIEFKINGDEYRFEEEIKKGEEVTLEYTIDLDLNGTYTPVIYLYDSQNKLQDSKVLAGQVINCYVESNEETNTTTDNTGNLISGASVKEITKGEITGITVAIIVLVGIVVYLIYRLVKE